MAGVNASFICPPELKEELEELARQEGRSVSNLIVRLLREAIQNKRKPQEREE